MAWGNWSQTFSPEVWSASQWGTKYYSINLNWRYRQDIAANQTQVQMISLKFNTLTSARGIHAATIHGQVSIANSDSAVKTCSNNMPSPPGSVTLTIDHTVTVTHNTDGTWPGWQVAWKLWVTGSSDSIQPNIKDFSCIVTNIPKIPRTSQATVNVSTQTMGSAIVISTNRASTEYTHEIYVKFSGDSSYGTFLVSGVNDTYTWNTGVSLASKIPNTLSGVWNILVRTKSGSTIIGDKVINVTLNVPSNIVPSVSSVAVAEATAGIAGQFGNGVYIQGRSTFKITVGASGNQGSTIKSYSISVDGRSYSGNSNVFTTQVINGAGTVNVTATVTDSRGRTASKTVSVTVTAYSSPSVSVFKAVRCTSAGVDSEEGTAVKISFNFAIASLGSKNTRSFKIQQLNGSTWTDIHTITDSYTTNSSVIKTGPFSVDSKFSFRAIAADFFTSATVYSDISPSFALINFGAGGKSLAFGGVSSNDGSFESYMATKVYNRFQVPIDKDLADKGVPFAGAGPGLTDMTQLANYRSYMGALTLNSEWNNVLSIRHRNGYSDGSNYGLYLRTALTRDQSLIWRKQFGASSWTGERTILDSNNYPNETKRWHGKISGSSGKGEWIYLGHITGSSDTYNTYIDIYTGSGYNGNANQNSIIHIQIKDAWQSALSATKSQGVIWWCDGTYHNSIQVQVRATANNAYQIWVYLPWGYWDGQYEVYTEAWFNRVATHQTSAPTAGTAQEVVNITPDMRGYQVGAIIPISGSANPANLYGGTWEEMWIGIANAHNSNYYINNSGNTIANNNNIVLYAYDGSNAGKWHVRLVYKSGTGVDDTRWWKRTG